MIYQLIGGDSTKQKVTMGLVVILASIGGYGQLINGGFTVQWMVNHLPILAILLIGAVGLGVWNWWI